MAKEKKKLEVDPNLENTVDSENVETVENKDGKLEQVKTAGEYPFTVELWDNWGTTSKKSARFGAKRYIEKGNVFLVNEKRGFKVPFPQENDDYKQYTVTWLEDEIAELEKKVQDAATKKSDISLLDSKEDIRKLKGYLRSLTLDLENYNHGSYMTLDVDGRPLFMFDRVGNYKLPVFKNIDTSTLYIPSEIEIEEASDLLKENDEKNKVRLINIAQSVFLALLVILILVAMYFAYQSATINPEVTSAMVDIAKNQDALTDKLIEFFETVANNGTAINESQVDINVNTVN